jgi:hypothetical protein
MAGSCGGLEDRLHFPSFAELPLADDYSDAAYYVENAHGMMVPIRSWCFFAEIVDDSLSGAPEFFHRVEVRDAQGQGASVLFGDGAVASPGNGANGGGGGGDGRGGGGYGGGGGGGAGERGGPGGGGARGGGGGRGFEFSDLAAGRTLFVRYASRFFFSDLTTQVLRVEDAGFVKVIDCGIDALLSLGQYYLSPPPAGTAGQCMSCGVLLPGNGGAAALRCSGCGAGRFCGEGCRAAFLPLHVSERHCEIVRDLEEVLSLDWERFVEPVKFSGGSGGGGG